MENELQIENKKFLTVTVLTLFLLSAIAISTASAQLDTTRTPDQTPTDANSEPISENPTLYTAQDNSTTATDDNSILDRTQDNSTASADDSTLYDSQNSESDNPNLIATQAQPDYLAIIIVLVVCVAVIASLAIFVSRRQTKNLK
jgi:ABC-type antimicrobial peptide transport system permease subunit